MAVGEGLVQDFVAAPVVQPTPCAWLFAPLCHRHRQRGKRHCLAPSGRGSLSVSAGLTAGSFLTRARRIAFPNRPFRMHHVATVALLVLAWTWAPGASVAGAQSAPAGRDRWLLAFDGASTNAVVHDRRLRDAVSRVVPSALGPELLAALGGPPDPLLVTDGRHVSMSACIPRACHVKGFLWLDAANGRGIGAILDGRTLRLGSRTFVSGVVPGPARAALAVWLAELGVEPSVVRFTGPRGTRTRLPASAFPPERRFRPPPGGPSFDCAAETAPVARATCADPELSELDLRTWRQAEEVRRAHSTQDARRELVAFHDAWRQRRDERCGAAADVAVCLRDEFARQIEALRNWLPAAARR